MEKNIYKINKYKYLQAIKEYQMAGSFGDGNISYLYKNYKIAKKHYRGGNPNKSNGGNTMDFRGVDIL
jgi:hypothetical protein